MAFWSDHSGETTLQDPKRKFRFKVLFNGIVGADGGSLLWYAKTADKPSFQISAGEHKYLNHTFYYPGSLAWQDVSISLVDPVSPDMAATLSGMIVAGGYAPPSTYDDLNSMSKQSATRALGVVTIAQLDTNGHDLEYWELYNAWITELKYGDLEYGSDDLTQIDVTLKYDWATLNTANTNGAMLDAKVIAAHNGLKEKEFFKP